MAMGDLTVWAWLWLALGAMLIGFAKTAIGGVGAAAVVLFALVLPARESTGAVLPLLLLGDVVAVTYYRRHADWAILWRLLAGVLPGLLLGAWFLSVVDDAVMRRTIGLIVLVMCGVQAGLRWRTRERPVLEPGARPHGVLTLVMGLAAGFATMTANAAGPVTTLYLIMAGLPMLKMLGTGAWFYLFVNLAKVPFSVGLGLIALPSLVIDALLVPAMLAGALIGILLVRRLRQREFELAALVFSAGAALLLLM